MRSAPVPKGSIASPRLASVAASATTRSASTGIEIDDFRDQQHLSGDAGGVALALQPLIDEALMSRVLVDDDDAVLRLRDDVGAVNLRARRAERRRVGYGVAFAHAWRGYPRTARQNSEKARCGSEKPCPYSGGTGACHPAKPAGRMDEPRWWLAAPWSG